MSEPADPQSPAPPAGQPPAATQPVAAAPALLLVRSAARWFWWIAGLSLINIVLFQTGSKSSFVVGLGITALADAAFAGNKPVGFLIDAIALGFFALMGWQGLQGRLWAFYVGLAVYALDALIYLGVQAWMPLAFHAIVIYFILRGVLILRRAQQAAT